MKFYKLLALLIVLAHTPCVYAYIDPGSGSFMLQMLIASLIGTIFTLKMYFKNLKEKLLKFLFPRSEKYKISSNDLDINEPPPKE